MTINISHLNVAQLEELAVSVQEEIKLKKVQARKSLIADLEALARQSGFSLAELLGEAPAKSAKPRAVVAAKYRNPNDAAQTWTGRGRKPLWLVAQLAEGKSLDSLAI